MLTPTRRRKPGKLRTLWSEWRWFAGTEPPASRVTLKIGIEADGGYVLGHHLAVVQTRLSATSGDESVALCNAYGALPDRPSPMITLEADTSENLQRLLVRYVDETFVRVEAVLRTLQARLEEAKSGQ